MYNKDQESYYDHRCLIVPQKDVLQIDIVGGGFIIGFKRWWNDLFLLSYSDRRAWLYFTSSRNMHLERFKQYRQYRNRIHPFSKFRNIWDCLMVHVFILHTIAFHHNTSVLFGKVFHMFFYYVALCVELIVIADLVVNLETGIIDSQTKRIILDTKQGILNYCCTKLFLHCGSAIPLQWIMLLSKRIARLPFFSGWPPELMQQIVLALTQNIFLTGDIVAEPWMSGDGLMIVDVGELAVYSAQEHETGHLIDGDYFGELSLVTDKEVRMSYVIAITSCKVLILKKTVFRILMRDHADLFSRLRLQLMQKNRIPEHQTV
ncbi:hypothetical protein O3G_MSEX004021 [Manduca sexta]|uniref:Cyclic nucleotide-binding domain-containing protein n=1 Tax=Manduca sexta TaxID=7130 RepID=A0A922CGN7_MANSE|nr:hypothetical protein O3G_MSEX004021 [Manduca sexta]